MLPQIYIGIDIGKNGAIGILDSNGAILKYHVMPSDDGDIYLSELYQIFQFITSKFDIVTCGIEDVHSIFGVSAKANFQFGRSLGTIEGLLAGFDIPFIKVAPKVWQKCTFAGIQEIRKPDIGLKKGKLETKKMALSAAQTLYPGETFFATKRSRSPHDGIIDSILIARYCYQNN